MNKGDMPAFPMHVHIQSDNLDCLGEIYGGDQQGMTLRQWYAGQALKAMLVSHGEDCDGYRKVVSENAFRVADAMMEAEK